ncbi:hypothetical protein [Chakrabartyella piscis]|uniref:hypothetical protein n=1 Tax=Chakrabartyella piscis TaxID=2918914 RepID=UPI0029584BCB|nr:hypothetical protein [Chakrabartyella piscis]
MRTYIYDDKIFRKKVTVVGGFSLFVALYAAVQLILGQYLYWLILVVGIYQFVNTFIYISNPKEVSIDGDMVSFSSYGKNNVFHWDEVEFFRIKEVDVPNKMYVRIITKDGRKGRYWINCKFMENGKELWDYFLFLEYEKEPGQLKFQAKIPKNPFATEEVSEPVDAIVKE